MHTTPWCREIRRQFPTQVLMVLRYTVFHEGSDEAVRILEAARMQDKFSRCCWMRCWNSNQAGLSMARPRWMSTWEIAGAADCLDLEKAETDQFFPVSLVS